MGAQGTRGAKKSAVVVRKDHQHTQQRLLNSSKANSFRIHKKYQDYCARNNPFNRFIHKRELDFRGDNHATTALPVGNFNSAAV